MKKIRLLLIESGTCNLTFNSQTRNLKVPRNKPSWTIAEAVKTLLLLSYAAKFAHHLCVTRVFHWIFNNFATWYPEIRLL